MTQVRHAWLIYADSSRRDHLIPSAHQTDNLIPKLTFQSVDWIFVTGHTLK